MSRKVVDFLAEFKQIAEDGKFYVIPRPSHNRTIAELGITGSMVKQIILSLTPKQYDKGPMQDKDNPDTGELYVFKSRVDGVKIYIKLKIDIAKNGDKIAKCISFHN